MNDFFLKFQSADTSLILCVIAAVIVIELIIFAVCRLLIKKSKTRILKVEIDKTTYIRLKQLAYNRGLTPQEFTKRFLENFSNDEK